jgi:hypothetical protein
MAAHASAMPRAAFREAAWILENADGWQEEFQISK